MGVVVHCVDGVCGRVTQVVIDSIDDRVTHLIVEPDDRQGLGRLVPVDHVEAHPDRIDLSYTMSEFDKLGIAEEVRFLPGVWDSSGDFSGYEPEQVLFWPFFGDNTTVPVTIDTLPVGEVGVRRGEGVHATDGRIGEVEGLVMDDRHHVSHVLLKAGHLFGRKEVVIPIGAVARVDEGGITLSLSKREVDDLPPGDFRHPAT
jgi:hypothetical protein